ncbi:MAG: hypothetical protein IPH20_01510 [Bacteroidales bacterium]|nr:hypothetical protein [Bacteroidales bacterium]
MKTKINIFRPIIACTGCMPAMLLAAQTYSEKREESKTYRVKPGTLVQVSNKYGNANIMNWEKDSVRFEVSISVQSKQPSKLNKNSHFHRLRDGFNGQCYQCRTVFTTTAPLSGRCGIVCRKMVNTSNNLQIHYTVYMPEANPVKIENKFGIIYLDSRKGKQDIILSNGDLQARDFTET